MNSGRLILSVRDALVSFGDIPVFQDLTFNIQEGSRIALVGRNGSGKSTLMNIIGGTRDLDDGERWMLEGIKIGYLQQEVAFHPEQTVRDFIFETFAPDTEEWLIDYRLEMVVTLELSPHDKMKFLSGGQLRRAALARALVEEPDILMLDEPTNHLDLTVIEWLENYLRSYRGTIVCVSHDRTFLANVSNTIFWLDRGKLKVCPKGFSYFEEWSTMLIEQEARELANRQKYVEQESEWASRGVKARRKRNVRRVEQMKEARDQLRADMSAFRKMMGKVKFEAGEMEMTSRVVAEFYNVSKSFTNDMGEEKTILNNFHLRILRGDKIGILGKNGSGKTSFIKMLVGELMPDSGSIKRKKELEFSYFDQKRKDLKDDLTLWKTLCPDGGDHVDVMGKARHVCGYLKDFLFDPAKAHEKVGTLSGGQKNRLMLAKILANPKTCLILDEPTNDLDMDTLDMLEDVLSQYKGTLIVVSHDRDFLDQTVSKIIAFEGDGKVEGVIGGYSDYLEMVKLREEKTERRGKEPEKSCKDENEGAGKASAAPPKKLTFKIQHELETLPDRIVKLEQEIALLTDILEEPSFYSRDPEAFNKTAREMEDKKAALAAAEDRWLELSEMQAAL